MRTIQSLHFLILGCLIACFSSSCADPDPQASDAADGSTTEAAPPTLFERVPAAESGITFANLIAEDPTQNYFIYEYLYNGGGVAIGDLNNDGLPDLYLTGNLMPDKVYLNKGGLKFEDITAQAITSGQEGWHTGVTMADVNNDGWLDIHVCRAGWSKDLSKRTNLFYVNNGDLTFTESAEKWGIADTTRSTQAAFFDMDDDGDLDLYVINTPMQGERKLSGQEVADLIRTRRSPTDRLYRNEGDRFTDITATSGIWNMGYGLGLSISDLDGDGRPDIYVANDYIERDYMYMNKGDGKFVDEIKLRTRHISNFGMGCDIADQNNDGLPDILVLDMVSEDHVRSKKNMSSMSSDKFWRSVNAGYHYQYMANSLQVNNGDGTFSELAQLAGVIADDEPGEADGRVLDPQRLDQLVEGGLADGVGAEARPGGGQRCAHRREVDGRAGGGLEVGQGGGGEHGGTGDVGGEHRLPRVGVQVRQLDQRADAGGVDEPVDAAEAGGRLRDRRLARRRCR